MFAEDQQAYDAKEFPEAFGLPSDDQVHRERMRGGGHRAKKHIQSGEILSINMARIRCVCPLDARGTGFCKKDNVWMGSRIWWFFNAQWRRAWVSSDIGKIS